MRQGQRSRHARGYVYHWKKIRVAVLARDEHVCQPGLTEGRVTPAHEVHHVRSQAPGGTDDLGNLLATSHPCHIGADLANRRAKPRVRRVIGADGYLNGED